MSKSLQAVRGMNDLLPETLAIWQQIEAVFRQVTHQFGFREIRTPLVESTALFKRSIGDVTDIVEKEMYTFDDRNGDSLSLRPEGTASTVRAVLEHGLIYNQIQRLWYFGQMFRHERPQQGRYRQFYQFGIETFGIADPAADVESIALSHKLWTELGIADHLILQINTLGTSEVRRAYTEALADYFRAHLSELDEDSVRRLDKNPLRILDSKNPEMQALLAGAPVMLDCLDAACKAHFDAVKAGLEAMGIAYEVNPRLVRGLDYYQHTVFEWVTDALGAQGTVCAGGRYDNLVSDLGGQPTPAVGFALGMERLVGVLSALDATPFASTQEADLYFVLQNQQAILTGLKLAAEIRSALPNVSVLCDFSQANFKRQFKKADKSGAKWALILAETECEAGTITIKPLRDRDAQRTIAQADLLVTLKDLLMFT